MAERTPSTSSESNLPSSTSHRKKDASRKEYFANRDATKVYLFDIFPRWKEFKKERNIRSDKDVAEMLLDAYQSQIRLCVSVDTQTEPEAMRPMPTTPLPAGSIHESDDFLSPVLTSTPLMLSAGTEAMQAGTSSFPSPIIASHTESLSRSSRRNILLDSSPLSVKSRRFLLDSSPLSVKSRRNDMEDVTLTASESDESCDDDTTLTASTLQMGMDESVELPLLEVSIEDDVFNTSIYGHNDEVLVDDGNEASDDTENIPVMTVTPEEAVQMEKCIVFTDTLMSLLKELHGGICKRPGCDRVLDYRKTYVGTCLVVSWGCSAGHKGSRWAAQPSCDKIRAGNLMLASALLLSGNSYTKVGLMFRFCNLQYFSKTLFTQYQSLYIAPAVNEFWEQHKQELWQEKAGKDVVLSGDGRNDSPGHCAQYCTYSLADMEDHAILQINIIDVREAAGKSNNMERIGFERGMDKLLTSQISVMEVVTDGHLEIAALMKKADKYKGVKHQNDVWHGGKSLAKKINAASKTKANEDLALWAPSVRNHFWYCSKHCDKDVKNIKDKWISILHHVVNEHEWIVEEGNNGAKCDHDQLSDDERNKPWLKKGSAAHKALTKIALDKRFLNTLGYYTHFRHTGFLESFHNHILMYAAKRQSYTFVGYRVRNQLAALDWNHHRERDAATTADGQPRMERKFSKRTKQWCAVKVLQPKQYGYIPNLLLKIFEKRATTEGGVSRNVGVLDEDPRRIAPNISVIPPPSVQSLVESHQSRF